MPFSGAGSIKALSIDLDNTLWDVLPTLVAAEAVLEAWLGEHCPAVLPHYRPDVTGSIRDELIRARPDRAHDLGFLRRSVMYEVFARAGEESALVEPAFEVFFVARNKVTLYDDVIPALTRLAERFVLVALTDGNADLRMVGLDTYFDHYVNATAVGAAKPAAAMFKAVQDYTGFAAEEILHIGDDPDKDIVGANCFGMHSAWVNRKRDTWPRLSGGPDVQIHSLGALTDQLLAAS